MADAVIPATSLGFLTVMDLNPHGLIGGYLILNLAGRPLEFHCTAPIKPSRVQQILYGPMLEPFLYGEQIGASLLRAASCTPLVLLVDQPAALAVREHIDLPTALSIGSEQRTGTAAISRTVEFTVLEQRLMVLQRNLADRDSILSRLTGLSELMDLTEPFGRIREAIEEAQRTSMKAA